MFHRDQGTVTPAGGHEGGKPKNLRYLVGGMIVIFLLGMAIVGASTKVLQRPGPDQGATEEAPADQAQEGPALREDRASFVRAVEPFGSQMFGTLLTPR